MAKVDKLPPGITRRGERFRVSIMVSGVRQTATCGTLLEAIQTAEALRLGVATGQVEKRPVWSLQEAADALMAERVQVNATSKASITTRRSNIKQAVDVLGAETSVDRIDYAAVMRLSNHLRVVRGFSPAYTNAVLVSVKMLLDHAWKSGRKTEAPAKIDLVKHKSGRVRFLSRAEEDTCLSWCLHHAEDDLGDCIMLLLDTGLRIGELCALTWRDVDLKSDRIHIWKSKSAEPRAVGLTQRVRNILTRRKVASRHPKVMAGHGYTYFQKKWQVLRAGVGMDQDREFVIHALRHTCCTRLVSAGIDLRTVQKWMGHENIQTTMRYAQFVPSNLFNAAAALEPGEKPGLRVVQKGD